MFHAGMAAGDGAPGAKSYACAGRRQSSDEIAIILEFSSHMGSGYLKCAMRKLDSVSRRRWSPERSGAGGSRCRPLS